MKTKPMYWLLAVTWKRRKDKPREIIALTTGGAFQVLCLSRELSKRLKVPESWIDFALYTKRSEIKKLSPELYRKLVEGKATY